LEGKRGTYARVVSGLLEGYLEEQKNGTSFGGLQLGVGCYDTNVRFEAFTVGNVKV
jgi:hypothetical protein